MHSEATLWSSFGWTYLLVSQRLWALDRTFFHYLGLQRLWIRAKGRGENNSLVFIFKCKWSTINSFLNKRSILYSSQQLKQKYFSDWYRRPLKGLLSYPYLLNKRKTHARMMVIYRQYFGFLFQRLFHLPWSVINFL